MSSPTRGLGKNERKELEELECKGIETQPQPTKSSPTKSNPRPTASSPTQPRLTTSEPPSLNRRRLTQQTTTSEATQPTSEPTQPQPTKSSPREGSWKPFNRAAEFPWCFVQVVHEESNWRGTWTLQVKDMIAMEWETERVPNASGCGAKYQRKRTKQFPFPPQGTQQDGHLGVLLDGGQDDLMEVWLGRP